MNTITFKELVSAQVRLDNSGDTGRTYDIAATVNIGQGGTVVSLDGGTVAKAGAKDGQQPAVVATFSAWGGTQNLNLSYTGIGQEEQAAVLEAVNAFMQQASQWAQDNQQMQLTMDN